jgi:hypothetical protein
LLTWVRPSDRLQRVGRLLASFHVRLQFVEASVFGIRGAIWKETISRVSPVTTTLTTAPQESSMRPSYSGLTNFPIIPLPARFSGKLASDVEVVKGAANVFDSDIDRIRHQLLQSIGHLDREKGFCRAIHVGIGDLDE